MSEASLAPMEGVTVFPTRLWLHLASRPVAMTTPFLRVTAVEPGPTLPFGWVPELVELRGLLPYELTPQLLGPDVENLVRAAALLPPAVAPVVELNCGCPSPNSAGRNAGSGILREPKAFGETIKRLSGELGAGRLAVKMRLGYDVDVLEALLGEIAGVPLARLTVHGRTRLDGYRGSARWDRIEVAARQMSVPTVASGDVLGVACDQRLKEVAPTTSGLMIGRGALRNPWVFEELRRGEPVQVTTGTLAHALLAFALLHEAWLTQPQKLLSRVASGRLCGRAAAGGAAGVPCLGTDEDAWRDLCASLSSLLGGFPRVLTADSAGDPWPVSPTAAGRLRYLWSYLREGLPDAFSSPALAKAKRLDDFFSLFFAVAA